LVFANTTDYAKPLIADRWDIVTVGTDASWFSQAAVATKEAVKDNS
jgi:hypothetical protein